MADAQYPILKEHNFPKRGMTAKGSVVLRDLGEGRPHRYATHWRNEGEPNNVFHVYGHYFADLGEAEKDFAARVRKEGA